MKRPSPRPPFKGLTFEKYHVAHDFVVLLRRLSVVDREDELYFSSEIKIVNTKHDADWYKDQREQSMPWLQQSNRKYKKFKR